MLCYAKVERRWHLFARAISPLAEHDVTKLDAQGLAEALADAAALRDLSMEVC